MFYLQQATARNERKTTTPILNFTRLFYRSLLPSWCRDAMTSLVEIVSFDRRSVPAALDRHTVFGHGLQDRGEGPDVGGPDDEFGRALVWSVVDDHLAGLLTAATAGGHVVRRPPVRVGALVTPDDARKLSRLATTHGARPTSAR
jgi:hypothetical protein